MGHFKQDRIPKPRYQGVHLLESIPKEDSEIVVEIGAGVGFHAIQYSLAHENVLYFALEHGQERFSKMLRRYENHPKTHGRLLPIQANAIGWITHFVATETVDRYFLLYPNPFPKKSQQKKRWHHLKFFEVIKKTLKPGGLLILATNEQEYFEDALTTLTQKWGFEGLKIRSFNLKSDPSFKPRTHFEKKYLMSGQTCYEAVFTKNNRLPV